MEPQPSQTDPVGTQSKRLQLVSPAEGAHSSGRVSGGDGGQRSAGGGPTGAPLTPAGSARRHDQAWCWSLYEFGRSWRQPRPGGRPLLPDGIGFPLDADSTQANRHRDTDTCERLAGGAARRGGLCKPFGLASNVPQIARFRAAQIAKHGGSETTSVDTTAERAAPLGMPCEPS